MLSISLSLVAVFIPLLFMGGQVGRLFREFAITLAVTILISALVSLTLVPMLCAKLVRRRAEAEEGAIARRSRQGFEALVRFYDRSLGWVLDRQAATLLVAAATLALTAYLYVIIPKGFFPVQDTGLIQAVTEAPQSVSFEAMGQRQRALAEAIDRKSTRLNSSH